MPVDVVSLLITGVFGVVCFMLGCSSAGFYDARLVEIGGLVVTAIIGTAVARTIATSSVLRSKRLDVLVQTIDELERVLSTSEDELVGHMKNPRDANHKAVLCALKSISALLSLMSNATELADAAKSLLTKFSHVKSIVSDSRFKREGMDGETYTISEQLEVQQFFKLSVNEARRMKISLLSQDPA